MSEPVFVDASGWVAIANTLPPAFAFDRHFIEAGRQYGFSLVRE
jgi:hypothetical protein